MNTRLPGLRRIRGYGYDLATLPGDLRLAYRLEGWSGVRAEFADRSVKKVYRKRIVFYLIEQDLAMTKRPEPRGPLELRALRPDEIEVIAPIVGRRKRAVYARRLEAGRQCIVALRPHGPVGFTWWTDTMERSIEFYPLVLPPGTVYGWDLYVLPSERSAGIGSALVAARLEAARARGFSRTWRLTATTNLPSLRTQEKTSAGGSRVVGELEHSKAFRRDRFRFRPAESAEWQELS